MHISDSIMNVEKQASMVKVPRQGPQVEKGLTRAALAAYSAQQGNVNASCRRNVHPGAG